MIFGKHLWIFFGLAFAILQGFLAAHIELTFDEAYYTLWARWPQLGYYDHPPLVAWLIAATSPFVPTEGGVRLSFWLMGVCLPALVYRIGQRLFDATTGTSAALIFMGMPLIAATPLATPDTPLVFFWTLAILCGVEIYRGHKDFWLGLGLALGLAALAKMTAAFLFLGFGLALMVVPAFRVNMGKQAPWAFLLALLVVSPFLIWNIQHGYATFLKQGARLGVHAFKPAYILEFLCTQSLLLNPLTLVMVGIAIGRRSCTLGAKERWLLATFLPAMVYFFLHALHDRVQGHWLAPLYPTIAVLTAQAMGSLRRFTPGLAVSGLIMTTLLYAHILLAWPHFGPHDPILRVGGWQALAAQTQKIAQEQGATYIVTQGYATTALLTFYGHLPVIAIDEPQRWQFRPDMALKGKGIGFASSSVDRLHKPVMRLQTLTRQVAKTRLEAYDVFLINAP